MSLPRTVGAIGPGSAIAVLPCRPVACNSCRCSLGRKCGVRDALSPVGRLERARSVGHPEALWPVDLSCRSLCLHLNGVLIIFGC